MVRKIVSAVLVMLVVASTAAAQDWARKMFEVTSHDFGTVAKGGKAEFRFVFSNIYLEDVHIQSAHASCGCTSVRIDNPTVKTYEKGAVVAWINSDSYTGQRHATVTVNIDKPFYAEVQLQVAANVLTDVSFVPGSVQFSNIDQGTEATQKVSVSSSGRSDWKVFEARCANPHIRAEVVETGRNYSQVWYDLIVHVDKDAPAGYIRDQVVLVTNGFTPQVPVLVEGRVQSSLSVNPSSLFLGVVQPGQEVTKQLIVQGSRPFTVTGVKADGGEFTFENGLQQAAKVHLIQVTYKAGKQPGKTSHTILITTDLSSAPQQVAAQAVVSDNAVTQK